MTCNGCDLLRTELKKLNGQLEYEFNLRKKWREQWCKDGNEIAQLREQLRDLNDLDIIAIHLGCLRKDQAIGSTK